MELKHYRKKTEVGEIPKDWEVKAISDCAYVIGGGTPSTFIKEYWDGEINWFTPTEIGQKKYSTESLRKITCLGLKNSSAKLLPKGTVLLTSRASIGDVSILMNEATTNQGFQSLVPKLEVNNEFLFYALSIQKNQLLKNSSGSTFLEISPAKVKATLIPLPSYISEQIAIANVLSDMDALITSLEKLIEKKKHIKQGVMQELLRPKEGWVEMSILELADNKKELFNDGDWIESEHIITEGIRLIQTGNIGVGNYIEKENKKYINEESFKSIGCKELIIGDILICRLAEPAGRACILPDIGEYKVVTSVDVTIFRPRAEIVNRTFLINVFSTKEWLTKISDMSGGTTHKRISRGALGRLKIKIPSVNEQNRIANILADLETEIQNLERKLKKNRMLKQGMMQELLTGKTRLI